jgi:aspartyl-tRNA(Asn)/glutamyl-tRNA(Gln) amidotransferase subunit A
MTDPTSAHAVASSIASRRVSAEEVVRAALDAAARASPGTFLQVFPDQALTTARAIDARLARGETVGPLAGVPVAIKDNICLGPDLGGAWSADAGRTTCGSRILGEYRSPYSATVARRLADAGAVIIGKTNLDEFAMGSTGEHSAFGPTPNPWDPARVPGGSSSGSAAAVASRVVPLALGSDTGGSVRQPAGWCNLVGIKPTYGRVSRYGLVAFASSLDQVGVLSRSVHDAALGLEVIAGNDAHDATSSTAPVPDLLHELDVAVEDLVIGVPRQARSAANHPGVAASLESAVRAFEQMGAEVREIDLAHAEYAVAAYYIIAPAEASSNLARFDGVRYGRRADLGADGMGGALYDLYARSRAEGFGREVQRRIMLGTHVLSSGYYDAYYSTALKARRLIKQDFDDAFRAGVHAVLMPASPSPALRRGEKTSDPLALYLEDVYTVSVNLAGLPGITVPAGFVEEPAGGRGGGGALPVGVQLIGPAMGEKELLRIARMFERASPHGVRAPAVHGVGV